MDLSEAALGTRVLNPRRSVAALFADIFAVAASLESLGQVSSALLAWT